MSAAGPIHILVVDDDPNMQRMVSDYLFQNNLHVAVASGSREMRQLLDHGRFNLIILDLRLEQGKRARPPARPAVAIRRARHHHDGAQPR